MPIRLADRLGAHFSRLELIKLADAGHFIPLEAPTAMAAALGRLATGWGHASEGGGAAQGWL